MAGLILPPLGVIGSGGIRSENFYEGSALFLESRHFVRDGNERSLIRGNDESQPPWRNRSGGCGLQQGFDLRIQIPRNVERLLTSVGSKEAGHSVVREMYAVLSLVDENG